MQKSGKAKCMMNWRSEGTIDVHKNETFKTCLLPVQLLRNKYWSNFQHKNKYGFYFRFLKRVVNVRTRTFLKTTVTCQLMTCGSNSKQAL